jgi:hypothetical protein
MGKHRIKPNYRRRVAECFGCRIWIIADWRCSTASVHPVIQAQSRRWPTSPVSRLSSPNPSCALSITSQRFLQWKFTTRNPLFATTVSTSSTLAHYPVVGQQDFHRASQADRLVGNWRYEETRINRSGLAWAKERNGSRQSSLRQVL